MSKACLFTPCGGPGDAAAALAICPTRPPTCTRNYSVGRVCRFWQKKKKKFEFCTRFSPAGFSRTNEIRIRLADGKQQVIVLKARDLFVFFFFVYRNVGLYGVPPFLLPLLVLVVRKYNFVIYLTLVCRTFGWKEPARERSAQRGRQTTAFRNAQLHRA